ncbi:YfjI family protein [Pelagibacterium sp. 26DY04]|uniref:DUF3987 domain-containing protein n=1 Tax=Pelagibacterium sp. 26DY04 TaxID=2967130 RepID=UPI002815BBDF|nr:DUF3987 domain-containing protein [Pelagibacterium sp. 26DY04]WMT88664.1 YfjI family protein [Pelagibacterium sp. 26DY04]
MTEAQTKLESISDIIQSTDTARIGHLYWGLADILGGDIMVAPEHKFGGGDWKKATRDTLRPAGYNEAGLKDPASPAEALCWCVMVSAVEACDPSSSFIAFFSPAHGDAPAIRQIAGPVEDKEIGKLVIARKLGMRPRMIPLLPENAELPAPANDNEPEPTPPGMHPDPFTPEAAGGLLGDIARWITDTAIVPVPELSLSAAIALMGGLFGGKALTPTDAGVNVYITTLMDTAGGKGHPPKAIRQIAAGLGATGKDAVTNGDHTSYAAIERTLRRSPSTAIVMDEFGLTLQDINAKNRNSVAASIRKFLLAVYDQSNSMFDGRIYASAETKKDAEPIAGPALTVLGMTTTETLYAGLSEASVSDGFLNRFLFVTAGRVDEIRPPSLKRALRVPRDLSDALKEALTHFPQADKGLSIRKHTVPMEGGEEGPAYALWAEIFRWQNDRFWKGDARNIIGRAAENTIRLATLRAISRCPAKPEVSRGDVAWAWGVVHASITAIRDGVRRHMSESPADRLRKSILAHVEEAGEGGLPYSKLLEKRGVATADHRQLSDALHWLVASDQIRDVNGRPMPGKGSKFVRKQAE